MFFDNNTELLKKLNIKRFKLLNSTNIHLKELAQSGAPSGTVVVADRQTAGRGRMDRTFLSPEGGLYMSVLLRPSEDIGDIKACGSVHMTALAAVAVREAIEAVTGKETGIKWVNDLFYEGKKVCGILTEGAINPIKDGFEYVVLGIGINLVGNFEHTALKGVATALYPALDKNAFTELKKRLTDEILLRLFTRYEHQLIDGEFFEDYRKGLFIIGSGVEVLQGDCVKIATVTALNPDFTLRVRYDDGTEASLNSGEVRLRVQNEEG